jgi:hypothetical protein
MNEFGQEWMFGIQMVESLIQGNQFLAVEGQLDLVEIGLLPYHVPASLECHFLSSNLDQDPSHGFRCSPKEMGSSVPSLSGNPLNQSKISLMH